jgi:hypothetical protein
MCKPTSSERIFLKFFDEFFFVAHRWPDGIGGRPSLLGHVRRAMLGHFALDT